MQQNNACVPWRVYRFAHGEVCTVLLNTLYIIKYIYRTYTSKQNPQHFLFYMLHQKRFTQCDKIENKSKEQQRVFNFILINKYIYMDTWCILKY